MVRAPEGSASRASRSASEFARSCVAADTQSRMDRGFAAKAWQSARIVSPMSSGWPRTGTFVTPGRSTSVSAGAPDAWTRSTMGVPQMPLPGPATAAVRSSISRRTASKSWNTSVRWPKTA